MLKTLSSIISLKRLKKNVYQSREYLEAVQLKKLKSIVDHAYKNVPYYQKLFDSVDLKPQDIKGIDDLKALPITDKKTMRNLKKNEIMAMNIEIDQCEKVFTSGSTGMPAHIYVTKKDLTLLDLVYLRTFLTNGLRFKHKRAFILDPGSLIKKKCWYHWLGLGTYVNISCFSPPEEQFQALKDHKPDFIHSYPSSLDQIAEIILTEGEKKIKPVLISTAAELLDKKCREHITKAFGVMPYDRYAARECGNIAWECDEHNGYHINIDTLVVEFVRNGKSAMPGESGDIVVSNLHSYAMPFIRYKIGDIGISSARTCPCGIQLPLMEIVEGRDEDFVLLKGGTTISPMVLTGTLDHIPGVKQFKVIQESIDTIQVDLARGKDFNSDTVNQAKDALMNILGKDMKIICRDVDDIPRESSGKVRAVISKIKNK